MLDNMIVAAFLSSKRRQKGLSQSQVATRLGVSFQAVSRWENGAAYPGIETLFELSRLLGVTVDEILKGQDSTVEGLTYRKAGIDVSYTDSIKKEMTGYIDTSNRRVLNGIGAFASLYDIQFAGIQQPVLVLKAEEPGSKQYLALKYGYTESICHDMVNHLVNDIAVMGATPLAVLDTIVCGRAEKETVKSIVKGVSEACRENECSLVGGETSIQPSVVGDGVYILTSTIAGIVERDEVIDGRRITEGDVLLAVASNGLHTNGYTLVRKIMDDMPKVMDEQFDGHSFLETVMKPHTPYYRSLKGIFKNQGVNGMAHITGGGLEGNLRRIIPEGLCAQVDLGRIKTLPLFSLLRRYGSISDDEMLSTFNCGVGLVVVVRKENADAVKLHLSMSHVCYGIGEVISGSRSFGFQNSLAWQT